MLSDDDSPEIAKTVPQERVLDSAEVYRKHQSRGTVERVQGDNTANASAARASRARADWEHRAYLHRADHFARLAVDMFLDDTSPLPKFDTAVIPSTRVGSVTAPSSDVWMLAALEMHERMTMVDEVGRTNERG